MSECAFDSFFMELLSKSRLDSDERTERRGFEIGYRFMERVIQTRVLAMDHLEVIKLLCKDFWYGIFRKQIDKQLQCEPTTSEK